MIFASFMAWLQSRLGLVLGAMLAYAARASVGRLTTMFIDIFKKRARAKAQEKAQAKLEQDVQEGKARTDGVRENEAKWLNS